jgi:integrase
MAACGAAGRGFESLWARSNIDSSPQRLNINHQLTHNVVGRSVDRSLLQGECIQLFRAAIKSQYTRDPYERRLIGFLRYLGLSPGQFVSIAKRDASLVEKKIISFIQIQDLRVANAEITGATVSNSLKAVRLLLEMNDVYLNWKKIRRILPRVRRYALDRIPTVEEIREITDSADLRGKALTLLFISSGVREGAIEYFKVQDYTNIEKEGKIVAGRLVVYSGDPEMYITFITPEACHALDKYIEFRREHGERIERNSPLFRDKFDPVKGQYGHGKKGSKESVIPMTSPAVRQYYNRLLFSIGIRSERKRRHDFSVHGFRKFFKTKAEIGGMKPINVETLMAHSVGISDSYYRPREAELLDEYLRVVDHLSISTENKLKIEVEEMNKIKNIEAVNLDAISSLSDQVMKLMQEIEILKKQR